MHCVEGRKQQENDGQRHQDQTKTALAGKLKSIADNAQRGNRQDSVRVHETREAMAGTTDIRHSKTDSSRQQERHPFTDCVQDQASMFRFDSHFDTYKIDPQDAQSL